MGQFYNLRHPTPPTHLRFFLLQSLDAPQTPHESSLAQLPRFPHPRECDVGFCHWWRRRGLRNWACRVWQRWWTGKHHPALLRHRPGNPHPTDVDFIRQRKLAQFAAHHHTPEAPARESPRFQFSALRYLPRTFHRVRYARTSRNSGKILVSHRRITWLAIPEQTARCR